MPRFVILSFHTHQHGMTTREVFAAVGGNAKFLQTSEPARILCDYQVKLQGDQHSGSECLIWGTSHEHGRIIGTR